jgi:hypothetical protein
MTPHRRHAYACFRTYGSLAGRAWRRGCHAALHRAQLREQFNEEEFKTMKRGLLTDEMLARFDERAPIYDRENTFFAEDFQELRESGYLTCAVPEE